MKTRNKALVLTLCAVLLVVATVMGTLAYLTAQTDTITNTFTVGKVALTLDEVKVDAYGNPDTPVARVKGNAYKLIPGHTYTKDPTVHVEANSENSWIFVKVENGIAALEATTVAGENGYKAIANQITANHWTKLDGVDGVDNVYYKEYTSKSTDEDMKVFETFKIADDASTKTEWNSVGQNTNVTVTAYAVQKDGFDSVKAAWTAANFS